MMKFAPVASLSRPVAATAIAVALAGVPATIACAGDGAQSTTPPRVAADVAKVLESYLIGPKAAAELGCRVKWQTYAAVPEGGALKLVDCSPDAVLALNTVNDLTLVRPETGDRAWTASAADPVDRVLGMSVFPYVGRKDADMMRIGVMTDSVFYTLGADAGSTIARTRYKHVPSTVPATIGKWFIYGTTSGQVAWFNAATGTDMRSHLIDAIGGASPVLATPAVGGGTVVAADRKGGVVALGATTGDHRWNKRILTGVRASPAVGNSAVFVASLDQYLYAFDLASGATLWKYFTQTPLTSSPFVTGELVLQDVPGEGLVALTQNPESQPGGEVRWKRERVMGTAIGTVGNAAAFWCDHCHKVTLVSLKDGATVGEVSLPAVEHLEADTIEQGGFVAWSSDGRIERLSPIATAAPATANAAK